MEIHDRAKKTRPDFSILALVGIFLLTASFYWKFTAEDAYITARYALNFAGGDSLVFNRGERILAITSPLHALIEAFLLETTGNIIASYKVLSLLLFLASLFIILRFFRDSAFPRFVSAFLILLPPCMAVWTIGGMETPMLLFTVTLMIHLIYHRSSITRARMILACTSAGVAFVIRFDSVIFTLPLCIAAAVKAREFKTIAVSTACALIAPLAWLLFSLYYYGDIFPTSFHLKTPTFDAYWLKKNARYTARWLTYIYWIPLMAALPVFARGADAIRGAVIGNIKRFAGVHAGLIATLAYGLTMATKHMMFSFRFFVPFVPALALVTGDLYRSLDGGAFRRRKAAKRFFLLFMMFGFAFELYQAHYIYTRSLNGLAPRVEYTRTGLEDYAAGFMRVLEQSTGDIKKHWASLQEPRSRRPRIKTFAEGVMPFTYPEAYFFGGLVSYRRRCHPDTRLAADYIYILSPLHGSIERQLDGLPGGLKLVSSRETIFEGEKQSFLVYFNPNPAPNRLPARVDGECKTR